MRITVEIFTIITAPEQCCARRRAARARHGAQESLRDMDSFSRPSRRPSRSQRSAASGEVAAPAGASRRLAGGAQPKKSPVSRQDVGRPRPPKSKKELPGVRIELTTFGL